MKSSITAARTLSCLLVLAAVRSHAAAPTSSPAQVTHPVSESDLNRIVLTPAAERRLGIITVPVTERASRQTRLVGADVILPLASGSGDDKEATGSIGALLPSTTPSELLRLAQAQIDADVQIEQARIQAEVAGKALARARQMLQDKAGAVRAVDETKGQSDTADANLKAAESRRALLGPSVTDVGRIPQLWLRAPVYVGDLDHLDTSAEVQAGRLSGGADPHSLTARPVSTFPSANAAAGTVDLFYEIMATNSHFRLGQRVGVSIPMNAPLNLVAVPWSSVVQDTSGGAWVYERIQPQTYVRRRVLVHRINGTDAELARGPAPGAEIVTEGTAELFGTEFGGGK